MVSLVNLAAADLQFLAQEARRNYTDVKNAAENALALMRRTVSSSGAPSQLQEPWLYPFLLACHHTDQPAVKLVAMALGSIQKFITNNFVAPEQYNGIVQTLEKQVRY
jgi:hypothetical protein